MASELLIMIPKLVITLFVVKIMSMQMHRRRIWGGGKGHVPSQDFAINKELPFSFLGNAPYSLRRNMPSKCRALPSLRCFLRPWPVLYYPKADASIILLLLIYDSIFTEKTIFESILSQSAAHDRRNLCNQLHLNSSFGPSGVEYPFRSNIMYWNFDQGNK